MMNNEHWWKDKDRGKPKHSERNLTISNPHSVVQSWHLTGRDTARSDTDNSDTTQAGRTRNSGVPSKEKIFLLSKTPWRDLASTQPPIHSVPEVFSWKAAGAYSWTLTSVYCQVINAWSYTSIVCAFTAWSQGQICLLFRRSLQSQKDLHGNHIRLSVCLSVYALLSVRKTCVGFR